ncbi:uncharacterized protein LOC128672272 [Plodia interpunctella]|uniref:uncharacterized protein LOC128672272 n=1 Tax=Plodia interpunctella TaxID=58824 RepID=UPI002367502C|nr:uncharacterized protein LOC128672272 [Plodia interpunctella]
MDQQQCPVCTLFLHNGMTLESHLDTHPKDQVIKALCNFANKGSSYSSRTSTPIHSERSYRSRSRTPATEDRWNGSHRGSEHDRYWRRTPSRTPKSNSVLSTSRNGTPDLRIGDINFDNNPGTNATQFNGTPFVMKTDKVQQSYQNIPIPEFDQQYVYLQDQQEDREVKYSRSAEYSALNNTNVFSHNMPTVAAGVKLQTAVMPAVHNRGPDLVKLLPKSNNILVKANVGGVQYIAPSVKPMHVVVPNSRAFLHKNVQNNMIMSNSIPAGPMLDTKCVAGGIPSSQFTQMSTGAFTPGTTVVTQNSQIIYREMVHNLDGKPFISNVPTVLSENVTNVAQTSSMYQNLMVFDQFGNTSCMYTTPPHIIPKACNATVFTSSPNITTTQVDKCMSTQDANKTLIIEVAPIVSNASTNDSVTSTTLPQSEPSTPNSSQSVNESPSEKLDVKSDTFVTSKGLKILSNIKVEVPVQHHKNMLNTIMDLTGSNDPEYPERCATPEKILPDMDDDNVDNQSLDDTEPTTSADTSALSHTFSVIKNVGNPPTYKEPPTNKSVPVDSKIDTESSDSCPVPDLICNEKPSVSPCSELSEQGDNSTDRTSMSPKPHGSQTCSSSVSSTSKPIQPKTFRSNTLRLNNIYVKKHKKILKIKNAKPFPVNNELPVEIEPKAASSNKSPERYTMNKIHQPEKNENKEKASTLQTVSVEMVEKEDRNDDNEFDVDTEEQSMDIEPAAPSSLNSNFTTSIDVVQVKEEINTSNEGDSFSNEASGSSRQLTPLETLRPINVISYPHLPGDEFDEESNHRELLELEATSKTKQFVNMMNENYFGDNIYADYFTPDRVESFDSERGESSFTKDGQKDGIYMWGESSQKESEFVLPNFIHESYKIAESSAMDYSEIGREESGERDSKADVLSESRSSEAPLNIRADERMPSRGELSGQESNGDMESPWTGMYTEGTPAEPYDLIARESWVSDGSEVDADEKTDALDNELRFAKGRLSTCTQCGAKFPTPKDLRAHKSLAHALPTCSSTKTSYSRMVTARTIKKEEKIDDPLPSSTVLAALDSKKSIATTILQVYDVMNEAKPKIEALVKQETKRRRKDYVCPTCKEDQITDAAFHAHLKIHPLECLTCGKCFFRRANLALHMKTHLGIKNYKCTVCGKRFLTRQKLSEHHNAHTGRAPVKCTVCSDSFRRYSNMVQHRDRHHFQKKAKVRDYVCRCGAIFHSKAKLQWHAETHEERPKACLYCSDKFVHAASLTRHVRRSHNEYYLSARLRGKVDNVPCPVCKQVYLRTNLRAHLQTHSGKRPHLCIICNKAFTTKWNLKLHRWTHMSRSAKPFKCSLCKGAFIRQTEYISHMNAHKSVKPYTCNYCGCQFIRKYNCQRHVREHEMAKKYVCKVPECGKSFHRSYYLSEHMKVHSGARPFSCNICGKTSSNKSNHNKHVKIHHAREPVATEA